MANKIFFSPLKLLPALLVLAAETTARKARKTRKRAATNQTIYQFSC